MGSKRDLVRDLEVCKTARDGWMKASDEAQARIRELEAMLNEQQDHLGVVRADNLRLTNRIAELEAVLRTVPHEPGSLIAKVLAGSPPSDATPDRGGEHG